VRRRGVSLIEFPLQRSAPGIADRDPADKTQGRG